MMHNQPTMFLPASFYHFDNNEMNMDDSSLNSYLYTRLHIYHLHLVLWLTVIRYRAATSNVRFQHEAAEGTLLLPFRRLTSCNTVRKNTSSAGRLMRHVEYLNMGSHSFLADNGSRSRDTPINRGSSVIKPLLSSKWKLHATRHNYTLSTATWEFLDKQPLFPAFYSIFRAHSVCLMRDKWHVRSWVWLGCYVLPAWIYLYNCPKLCICTAWNDGLWGERWIS